MIIEERRGEGRRREGRRREERRREVRKGWNRKKGKEGKWTELAIITRSRTYTPASYQSAVTQKVTCQSILLSAVVQPLLEESHNIHDHILECSESDNC
jgi:IS5 family transposase